MVEEKKLYIIGAGFAGRTIADDIKRKKVFGEVCGFLDDDPDLIGKALDGIVVFGPIKDAVKIMRFKRQDEAIIAIPSASRQKISEIYETLKQAGVPNIKILPSISQVISGDAHLIQTRNINVLDVLGRTPVTISLKESLQYLRQKRVLITGAGGSIGSELARQLLSGGAQRIYLLGHGENSIYQINRELLMLQSEGVGEKATIVPIIGDIADKDYCNYIISKTKTAVVFHCAAYKHVPLMEENPVAVMQNNVFGTKNLLDACLKNKVERFVLISTDKAVEPVSTYGFSKMLCEKLVLQAAKKAIATNGASNHNSCYMFVRFANVLGSRGSILPLFMEQIKNGGPLTVTTKNMERYFMTIPEACSLVLKTGGVGENGHSYLLDMGEPIKIIDLAKSLIKFFGLELNKDIEIKFVGIRPGEREKEPLWTAAESPKPTEYQKIMQLENLPYDYNKLDNFIEKFKNICFYNDNVSSEYRNKDLLQQMIDEYKHTK